MPVDNNSASALVLKQLETLANNIQTLNAEIQDLKQQITRMREREDRVEELRAWKQKVDDVVSPTQMGIIIKEVEELKLFKAKSITVFMVVQFLMGLAIAVAKLF
jgi:outer membrane murein-binding lipoprotein Lpp